MAFKRYSRKEPLVFVWVVIPYIVFLNLLAFGSCIFTSLIVFAQSLLSTGVYMCIVYFFFGMVAIFIQKRFSSAGEMFKRIAIMLPVFYLMNCIAISVFFIYIVN